MDKMNQHDFEGLLKKYLAGQTGPDEDKLLDEWAAHQIIEQHYQVSETEDIDQLEHTIWKRLQSRLKINKVQKAQKLAVKWLTLAASFLLVAFLTYTLVEYQNQYEAADANGFTKKISGVELKNTSTDLQTFHLLDGSVVKLQPNSALVYESDFGLLSRSVYLNGEGFFEVKKDSLKPFLVHCNGLTTEVLGTSFTVKSLPGMEKTEVSVVSGVVKVYKTDRNSSLKNRTTILKANHKAVYDKKSTQIEKSLVEKPVPVVPVREEDVFIFKQEPLIKVFLQFEVYYNIEIHLLDKALNVCTFTGDISGFDPIDKIKIICKAIHAEYEISDEKILIRGEGCD